MRPLLVTLALLALTGACRAQDTWALESWTPPFDYRGTPKKISYQPLEKARKHWRICASYPHLKDSYWLSVNYGMVRHARTLGVALEIVEAGGYPNLDKQKAQITDCTKSADALIVGTVAAVNDIDSAGIVSKSGVSWISMGEAISLYFASLHPKGSPKVRVAWFPGPKGAGWVGFVEEGFQRGVAASSAEIVSVKWGDTGFEDQLLLLEDMLEEHPDIDYIIGSAVTVDAAVSLLRAKNLTGKIGVLADYSTHGTYRAIKRGKVLAAPTDSPVLQGELSIDQAVRALEGTLTVAHAGPTIRIIDGNNIKATDINDSLAPASFKPTFRVE